MRKTTILIVALLLSVLAVVQVEAATVRLYIVPSEVYDPGNGTVYYGPLYFKWRFSTGDLPRISQVDYGFTDGFIVLAELTQAQHDWLIVQPGAFAFPDPVDLDSSIDPGDVDGLRAVFEGFNIPTDWLTPSNTYRELLRGTYGIFRFAQRYRYIATQNGAPTDTYLFSSVNLDTKYREFSSEMQAWFSLTAASFGLDPGFIKPNNNIRQMLKAAGDYLAIPLELGGYTF